MLTQERLKEQLSYDPETGHFTQILRTSQRVKVGDRAGSQDPRGYRLINICGRREWEHRLVWLYIYGVFPDFDIDHINGNKSDNRLCNLRAASRSENNCNSVIRSDSTTKYRNVHLFKRTGKYQVQVRFNGKRYNGGYYDTAEQANIIAIAMRKQLHGEFAK